MPLLYIFDSLLNSYSIVLFSKNRWLGLILLLATLNTPLIGICGIIGTLIAIITVRLLKFTSWQDSSGYYSFNSLLVSLGVAYFYPVASNNFLFFFITLTLCSLITALLWVALNALFRSHIGLPSLSLAFVIIMSFVCFVYNRITGLPLSIFHHDLLFTLNSQLSILNYVSIYLYSMGSIFFQPNLFSGLLVAIVVFLYSRIAFLLSIIGFAVGYAFLSMNTTFSSADIMLAGFNIVLTAIVIGGVFFVPSITSFIIAAIASLSGALIGIAIQSALYSFAIPPLAIPFNFTVLVLLYAFKMRLKNSNPYLIDFYANSPEANLEYYHSNIIRFYEQGLPQFFLPFNGEWTVTQGQDSEHTHKLQWAQAWDFEILDENGSKCRGEQLSGEPAATALKDYYCFDKPVIAPASGTVVRVVDGIPDNPINQMNLRENWGNLVIIQHSYQASLFGIFSLLCHLKQGSIQVTEGQYVRAGEILARCGNSGRSPVPHLHFHLQGTAEPGSPTIPANLVNYIIKNKTPPTFVYSGIPFENDRVVALQPELKLQDLLHFKVDDNYNFRVETQCLASLQGTSTSDETWDVKVDFWGNLSILSKVRNKHACSLQFSIYNGIFNALNFNGNFNTALRAFALCLPRFPYTESREYCWKDNPPLGLVLSPLLRLIADFFSFIARPLTLTSEHTARYENPTTIVISGKLNLNFIKYKIATWETKCIFSTDDGITEFEVTGPRTVKLKACRTE